MRKLFYEMTLEDGYMITNDPDAGDIVELGYDMESPPIRMTISGCDEFSLKQVSEAAWSVCPEGNDEFVDNCKKIIYEGLDGWELIGVEVTPETIYLAFRNRQLDKERSVLSSSEAIYIDREDLPGGVRFDFEIARPGGGGYDSITVWMDSRYPTVRIAEFEGTKRREIQLYEKTKPSERSIRAHVEEFI